MIKLKDLIPKTLNESTSLFKNSIGPYFLSIIMRGSSSMEAPNDYEESMIFKKNPKTGKNDIVFQDSGSWINYWNKLKTEKEVEDFIKKQQED